MSIFKIIILNIIDFRACLCYNSNKFDQTRKYYIPEAFSLNEYTIWSNVKCLNLISATCMLALKGREILKGVNLLVRQGEVHALMGPNGTGKSTLAYTLMGHPNYVVTEGEVWFKGQNLLELEADQRSHLGLFLAFQYPVAIPGVSMANFLRAAINAQRKSTNPQDKGISVPEFRKLLKEEMDLLKMDHTFAGRYLNEGFLRGRKEARRGASDGCPAPRNCSDGRDGFGS